MRPDASFADVPIEVRRRVAGGERVALVLLDALGLRFLHRHEDHPLLRRLEITPLRSQFPSTTTALAAPGREVWLRSAPGNERWFRGQHGGLDPAETETYLAEVRPE